MFEQAEMTAVREGQSAGDRDKGEREVVVLLAAKTMVKKPLPLLLTLNLKPEMAAGRQGKLPWPLHLPWCP